MVLEEEVVCQDASLGKAIQSMMHFKVDPEVTDKIFELVFSDEFFWDVRNLDADVFWLVQGGAEIEVLKIHCGKASIGLGEYAVDEEFDKFN